MLPILSAYDPAANKSEGSIDPLGLVPIADRLSVSLVPGVRERMKHPRFLSLIAAGAALCLDYDEDKIASDGISPPIQVFEWYVVQALVKNLKGNGLKGLPGSDKGSDALKKNLPLNASRYLRIPSVFGFYGVYKTLARDLGLINGDRLAETGDKLIRIWEKEQGLTGFYSTNSGEGLSFKMRLKDAINDGLAKAQVDRNWNWSVFDSISEKMNPGKIGRKEAQTIFELLSNDKEEKRKQIIDCLIRYGSENQIDRAISEYHFHRYLQKRVTPQLAIIIKAIQAYEQFSRTLTNAFESILYKLSVLNNKGKIADLQSLSELIYAATNTTDQYIKCIEALAAVKENENFQTVFGRFGNKLTVAEFIESLIDHHLFIQKRKPPTGKLPWVEPYQKDMVILRPSYSRKHSLVKKDPNEYVYYYRSNSLYSFMIDLRRTDG
jgi:hypothetical protein